MVAFTLCKTCSNKICLRIKTPCEEVEGFLRSIGIWDKDWIRPKLPSTSRGDSNKWREIPFSSLGENKETDSYK
jgi:hypothetical protein